MRAMPLVSATTSVPQMCTTVRGIYAWNCHFFVRRRRVLYVHSTVYYCKLRKQPAAGEARIMRAACPGGRWRREHAPRRRSSYDPPESIAMHYARRPAREGTSSDFVFLSLREKFLDLSHRRLAQQVRARDEARLELAVS